MHTPDTEARQVLDALLQLSETLLEQAKGGDWDAVAVGDTERRRLAGELTRVGSLPEGGASTLGRIAALDALIRSQADRRLATLAGEHREWQRTALAQRGYQDIQQLDAAPGRSRS